MKKIALAWRLDGPLDPTLAILTLVKGAPIVTVYRTGPDREVGP